MKKPKAWDMVRRLCAGQRPLPDSAVAERFFCGVSDKHVGMYEKFRYGKVDGKKIVLDDGTYYLMMKPVLSHVS